MRPRRDRFHRGVGGSVVVRFATVTTVDEDALAFNPFDPEFRRDPYPTYARLRTEDPVH